jgi:hypothetical protein
VCCSFGAFIDEDSRYPAGRDLRLDLFRGVANWGIFLDHIPNNVVNWVTTRNYGFSDAADLFIFISGYTVAFVFARMMLERGFIVGATRLLKRVWQINVAHVFLFVLYLAEIGYLAQRYGNPGFADEFNIRGFLANPAQFLFEGLMLRFKPVNMDVLPLYIVLMGVFPPILFIFGRARAEDSRHAQIAYEPRIDHTIPSVANFFTTRSASGSACSPIVCKCISGLVGGSYGASKPVKFLIVPAFALA